MQSGDCPGLQNRCESGQPRLGSVRLRHASAKVPSPLAWVAQTPQPTHNTTVHDRPALARRSAGPRYCAGGGTRWRNSDYATASSELGSRKFVPWNKSAKTQVKKPCTGFSSAVIVAAGCGPRKASWNLSPAEIALWPVQPKAPRTVNPGRYPPP